MELLVRVVSKPKSGNTTLDAGRTEAGDVIVFAPDGHIWGRKEVSNPEWRIVRVPGLDRVRAEALTASEVPTAMGGNRLLRKRQMRLDVEALDAATNGALLADRTATPRGVDCVILQSDFIEAMELKSPLRDPRFIGPRKAVVG